jgi:hypothetical protein
LITFNPQKVKNNVTLRPAEAAPWSALPSMAAVMVIQTDSISIAHPRVPPQGAGAAFPQKIVSCRENIPGNFRP